MRKLTKRKRQVLRQAFYTDAYADDGDIICIVDSAQRKLHAYYVHKLQNRVVKLLTVKLCNIKPVFGYDEGRGPK